jgi:prepilin-type N-terminal cleavage/methylation domain-containing protein
MMSRHNARGFTLVEMMIVITIIGLLAGLTLPALNAARTAAKIAKTKTLVTRLHYIVMDQYDSYRTRRPAMDLEAYAKTHGYGPEPSGRVLPRELARARVNAIRDMIRLEMPDRWTDVTGGPLVLNYMPSVSLRYLRLYKAAFAAAGGDPVKEGNVAKNAAAECLYMIVMSIPNAAEQFHASDIGDVDNDGLPEFIDAWGRPIRFLRWPAGFYMDPDNNYNGDSNLQFGPKVFSGGATNPKYQPDPFDPRNILQECAVYPLIYSAGPDGIYDINIGVGKSGTYQYLPSGGNLYTNVQDDNTPQHLIGLPLDGDSMDGTPPDGALDHYDNIHNHRLETGRGGT